MMLQGNLIFDEVKKGNFFLEKPVKPIEAIYFEELSELQPDFKVALASGELKCSCCNDPLKAVGIHSVEVIDGELKWTCQKVECVLTTESTGL